MACASEIWKSIIYVVRFLTELEFTCIYRDLLTVWFPVLILTGHEAHHETGDRMLRYLVYLISIIYSWNK